MAIIPSHNKIHDKSEVERERVLTCIHTKCIVCSFYTQCMNVRQDRTLLGRLDVHSYNMCNIFTQQNVWPKHIHITKYMARGREREGERKRGWEAMLTSRAERRERRPSPPRRLSVARHQEDSDSEAMLTEAMPTSRAERRRGTTPLGRSPPRGQRRSRTSSRNKQRQATHLSLPPSPHLPPIGSVSPCQFANSSLPNKQSEQAASEQASLPASAGRRACSDALAASLPASSPEQADANRCLPARRDTQTCARDVVLRRAPALVRNQCR